jgi:SAM-dependent methyltransferase
MSIEELERIALASHKGRIPVREQVSEKNDGLPRLEWIMHLSFPETIKWIKRRYPSEPIIVGEVGCYVATAVADMDKIDGVEAFGIDLDPILDSSRTLPEKRLIVADINQAPHIPDNSFHYVISNNCLSYTAPNRSFPEIFRILKPGGIADIHLESWVTENRNLMRRLPISQQGYLKVTANLPDFYGSVDEFLEHIEKLSKTDVKRAHFQLHFNRFVMEKPSS